MSDCVLWTGRVGTHGYGVIGASTLAHRMAWADVYGPIPHGMVIHHVCENKRCVNVEHLRCITHAEHNAHHQPVQHWVRQVRERPHCPHGHLYTPETTMYVNGRRRCRTCDRARSLAYYHRHRERLIQKMRERKQRLREAPR